MVARVEQKASPQPSARFNAALAESKAIREAGRLRARQVMFEYVGAAADRKLASLPSNLRPHSIMQLLASFFGQWPSFAVALAICPRIKASNRLWLKPARSHAWRVERLNMAVCQIVRGSLSAKGFTLGYGDHPFGHCRREFPTGERRCRITLLCERESISRIEMTTINLNYSPMTSSPAIVPLDW